MTVHGEHGGYADAWLYAHDIVPVPIAVRSCLRCGAIVADEDLHDIFHAKVDSTPL